MWSALSNVVGPVLGAVTGLWSAKQSYSQQSKLNEQQIALAREQMAWQQDMSSTAHQREVKDLRKAGLNPILSAKYGGASTGSPVGIPQLYNPMNKAVEAMNSAKMLASVALDMGHLQKLYYEISSAKSKAELDRLDSMTSHTYPARLGIMLRKAGWPGLIAAGMGTAVHGGIRAGKWAYNKAYGFYKQERGR